MPVHEKILLVDKEKAKYCYLTLLLLFHFSAIIFHVDSCESYATLDPDERQKSGRSSCRNHLTISGFFPIRLHSVGVIP